MKHLCFITVILLYTNLFGRTQQGCTDTINAQEQLFGPATPAQFSQWLQTLKEYRTKAIVSFGLNDSNYDLPQLKWTRTSFIQPQMMAHERYFYDPVTMTYTVDKYLQDLRDRYGGIDSVLIWYTYTNIGTDDRNQFDLLRDMPGFPNQVADMIQQFHQNNVRVYFPYNPWDQGTRDEGVPDYQTIAQLWKLVGADGFNGDTMGPIPEEFFDASYNVGHPIALEAENLGAPTKNLNWQVIGWGYWDYPEIPCVSTFKWLIPKHVTNVCNRWATDHTNDMQFAFFNGVGFESWENVWGIWNQLVPRDAEALRRIATILRFFGTVLITPYWEPHTPTLQAGAYASKFPSETNNGTLWTLVNRSNKNLTGSQLQVPHADGMNYYDVYHGVKLNPARSGTDDVLSFFLEANGYGAVWASPFAPDSDFLQFLARMNTISAHPLEYYSNEWNFLPQEMLPNPKTPTVKDAFPGSIEIPSADYIFVVNGIEIEGYYSQGVDVQYPWESAPYRHHHYVLTIQNFFIDKYPVTNAQYKAFLATTGYRPKDSHNFLKHWVNGSYPTGWENKPVTWVSIEDARIYCESRNPKGRLPNEWEWQYAAQGSDGRLYPWGNTYDSTRVPVIDKSRTMRPPDDVNAHPSGASPFGVEDLVGNVYQWTNEFRDKHTRAAILRGGNYYQAQGSIWYQPQSYKLSEHTKYLLLAPSIDRSGGIGFRCVTDGVYKPPKPCISNVCGSLLMPAATVSLTYEGSIDWKHWGLDFPTSVDRKANGGDKIQASTILAGSPQRYTNNPNSFSWTDGTPDSTETASTTGIFVAGVGSGFKVTVPATTSYQTLKLYVGVYQASAKLTATLSDSSSPAYIDDTLSNSSGTLNGEYVIRFKSVGAGAVLTVIFVQTQDSGDGNVTLQSATLSE